MIGWSAQVGRVPSQATSGCEGACNARPGQPGQAREGRCPAGDKGWKAVQQERREPAQATPSSTGGGSAAGLGCSAPARPPALPPWPPHLNSSFSSNLGISSRSTFFTWHSGRGGAKAGGQARVGRQREHSAAQHSMPCLLSQTAAWLGPLSARVHQGSRNHQSALLSSRHRPHLQCRQHQNPASTPHTHSSSTSGGAPRPPRAGTRGAWRTCLSRG